MFVLYLCLSVCVSLLTAALILLLPPPLLLFPGTPGSGVTVSGEGGSDITTITGGVALTTTLPPTPSSVHSEAQVTQVGKRRAVFVIGISLALSLPRLD